LRSRIIDFSLYSVLIFQINLPREVQMSMMCYISLSKQGDINAMICCTPNSRVVLV